jgi:phosphatidylglycerol lysyltransferase
VTSRTANRLTLLAMLAMFVAAIVVLYHQLQATRPAEVLDRLAGMPAASIVAAVLLTALSYLVLTCYDFLALRYVRRKLRAREVLFASFTAFAFSNSIGVALLSGGSVRYRMYSALGLRAVEIGEIVVFCTLSYALGVCLDAGLMLVIVPAMAGVLHVPRSLALLIGAALVAVPTLYLAATLIRRRPIRLGRYHLRLPSVRIGVAQIALASIDQVLAGAVLYALLAPGQHIAFVDFLGVYLVAAPASVLSLVPGGLGVLETLIVLLLAQAPKGAILGTLVAYRFIYFLLPLALAMALVAGLQIARAPSDLGWLAGAVKGLHARLAAATRKDKGDKAETATRAFGEAPR